MKKSTKNLPKRTQNELAVLQELILKYLPNVRMIILYGSYARGKHVFWEGKYDEHGGLTHHQSDLNILVICDTEDPLKEENDARARIIPEYKKQLEWKRYPAPPQIVVENTEAMLRAIQRAHCFFQEIMKEGILVYNDGMLKLGKAKKLSYRQIKQYAEEEYAECLDMAEEFLKQGRLIQAEKELKLGSFLLHQACEHFYKTYMLVYGAIRPKPHQLGVLETMVNSCSQGFANIFPLNTPQEKQAFDKLCRAYIEAQCSPHFTVSTDQYEYMLAGAEALREATVRECAARMAYYDEMIEKEERGKI